MACELYQNWCNTQNVQSLAQAAEILGVFPGESRISLNEYYVVFPGEKKNGKNQGASFVGRKFYQASFDGC